MGFLCLQTNFAQVGASASEENNSGIAFSNLTNWTTYESQVSGISFNYPAEWDVEEKQNRFDSGGDVTVSDGFTKFSVLVLPKATNDLLVTYGLVETTRTTENAFSNKEGITIIEDSDFKKYKIDGERSGTILLKNEGELIDYAQQFILVEHNKKGYALAFQDSTLTFDEPATQNIMNRILQSFRFLT